jgi:exosortase E/protease (VPEID-CTERM system)
MSSDTLTPGFASAEIHRDRCAWPLAWPALLALTFVAELVLLTVRFDSGSLGTNPAWWAVLLGHGGKAIQLAIAVIAGILLVRGIPLWQALRGCLEQCGPRWLPLLAHLAAYASFFAATVQVLERRPSAYAEAWFWLWLALAALTVLAGALAILPLSVWLVLVRGHGKGMLAGGLIGVLAWQVSTLTGRSWDFLAESTFWVVQFLLQLFYPQVVCVPANRELGTSTFTIEIAPECSGYEGMGLMAVFVAVFLVLFRQRLRFPQAFLLLPLGAALIWLCNCVRLTALIALGSAGWRELAVGGFHSQAGWLTFNLVALGLVASSGRLGLLAPAQAPAQTVSRTDPTLAFLAPFLILLAGRMLAKAFSTTPEALYPLALLAAVGTLCYFKANYGPLRWSWSWTAAGLGVLTAGLWLAVSGPDAREATSGASAGVWESIGRAFRVLGYILVVPLVEELAFRGYLLRRLIAGNFQAVSPRRFTWVSFVVSSVLFGVLHGANWLPGILAGMLFALAVYRRGRLRDAVTAHVTANSVLALAGLLAGDVRLLS